MQFATSPDAFPHCGWQLPCCIYRGQHDCGVGFTNKSQNDATNLQGNPAMMTHAASTLIDLPYRWDCQLLQNRLSRVLLNRVLYKVTRRPQPTEDDLKS